MKYKYSIQTFFVIATIFLSSSLNAALDTKEENQQVDDTKGLLIIKRDRYSPPLAYKPMIMINGISAFYLPSGYHAEIVLNSGRYEVTADWKLLHGVTDSSISVDLKPGAKAIIDLSNRLDLSTIVFGAVTIGSKITTSNDQTIDLSGSKKVTRFQGAWLNNAVGGFQAPETMSERYEFSVNSEKIIADFKAGDNNQKMEIAKFLIETRIYEEAILQAFEAELLAQYKNDFKDKRALQPIAYLCRYLTTSRMMEFQPTVIEVKNNAASRQLRNYAERYFERDY